MFMTNNTQIRKLCNTLSHSKDKQINTSLEQDKCPAYPEAVTIIRSPKPSRDNLSLCYFVRRFVSPNDSDGFPGHFTFLPELYDHHNHGLLETATLSVSQLAAYNQFGGEELQTQSLRNHVSVIRDLQKIFQHNDQLIAQNQQATDEHTESPYLIRPPCSLYASRPFF